VPALILIFPAAYFPSYLTGRLAIRFQSHNIQRDKPQPNKKKSARDKKIFLHDICGKMI
jgi:hypothetical protein